MSTPRIIIFSDLDGSLLDHNDYGFTAALPALTEIRRRAIPLILATSKTLAEVMPLNRALHNPNPVIVENGGALACPVTTDFGCAISAHESHDDHAIVRFSPPYAQLRRFVVEQREAHAYQLIGFGDMTTAEVAEATGLTIDNAALAKQRSASEPFIWRDSDARLRRLEEAAHAAGLRLTRGGRFWHLTGDTDKARTLHAVRELYAGGREQRPLTIALGDSDNDRTMLQNADIAVIVKRHDGGLLDCQGRQHTVRTEHSGPSGWNTAMLDLLARFDITAAPSA